MRHTFTALVTTAICLAAPTLADDYLKASQAFLSGGELFRQCRSETAADRASCASYVQAVNDTYASLEANKELNHDRIFCAPTTASDDRLRTLVLNWFEDHPNDMRSSAATGVIMAFAAAFPC